MTKHIKLEKILPAIAVMLVAILEVMDVSIVNVSLPHMMGSLDADAEQISWILTSYIVASAILMLLTGFLVNLLGRKRVLMISILGFIISSCFCGMANSLISMVIFRTMQGVFGATLVPLSQYILLDSFEKEKQGVAMAIWGIGLMAAPVCGPTLGGLITDELGWRWIFYLNIPLSLMALMMCGRFVKDTPRKLHAIDSTGLVLMVSAVASLQIFLDQGNHYHWFSSRGMTVLFFFSLISSSIFIIRGLKVSNHIINFALFRDRNFTFSTLIMAIFISAVMGITMLQPLMLEHLLGYSPTQAGLVLAPRGIACAIGLIAVSQLVTVVDLRLLVGTGILLCALGSWILSHATLQIDNIGMMTSASIQGLGMGFVFVPISTLANQTLHPSDIAEASGFFNFGRSLGSSIGISIVITMMTRLTQVTWNSMSQHMDRTNPSVTAWLEIHHMTIDDPLAPLLLGQELERQASMLAYIDCFLISTCLFLLVIPLLFFTKVKRISDRHFQ